MLKLWARLAILVKKRVHDSIIAKIALALSLVVVFCTTYLLILPALTISTGNSSSVFQSSEGATSQVESTTDDSQKASNQTEASSQTSSTESNQEKKDMTAAGTLSAETSDMTVTVTYEENTFSEPVQLKVSPVADTNAIDNKLTSLLSESKQSLSQAHSYDISFVTDDGKEVEPSKEVKVSMAFKNDLSTTDDKQAGWKLYHFVDNDVNQVQDLTESTDTDIKETGDGAVESVDFKSNTAYAADAVVYSTIYGKYYKVKSAIAAEDNDSFKAIETNLTKVEVAESEECANYAVGTAYAAGDVICQTVKRYYKVDSAVTADNNGGFNTVRAKLSKVNAESATGAKEYQKGKALASGEYYWREVKLYYKVNSAITAEANTGFSAIENSLTEVILSSNTKYSLDYEAATTYVDDDYVKVTSSGEYYRVATYIKAEYNSGFWAINSALTEIPGAWKMNGEAIKLSDYGVGSEEAPRTPRNGDIIMFTISYSWKETRTFTIEK